MLPPLSIDLHQARPIAPRLLMALLWKFSPSLAGAHESVPLLLLQKFHLLQQRRKASMSLNIFTMLLASKAQHGCIWPTNDTDWFANGAFSRTHKPSFPFTFARNYETLYFLLIMAPWKSPNDGIVSNYHMGWIVYSAFIEMVGFPLILWLKIKLGIVDQSPSPIWVQICPILYFLIFWHKGSLPMRKTVKKADNVRFGRSPPPPTG